MRSVQKLIVQQNTRVTRLLRNTRASRDNQWLGTSWSSSDPNTHVEGTDGTLSPFYVRSSYPYNPQYNEDANGGNSLDIFITSGSGSGDCIYTDGASFKTDGGEGSESNELLSILEMPEPETEREHSLQYTGRYNLYKKLLTDDELTASEPMLQSFFEEQNNANMGKLHRAIRDFRTARKDETEIEASLSALQSVQPANSVEEMLKEVMTILYSNATDLTGMDSSDEVRLREIAQLCPLDYGFSVYTARSALLKLDTLPNHYIAECERIPSPEQINEKKPEEETSNEQFTVYPNPNGGVFNLNYFLNQGESGIIEVFSAIGQQLYIGTLQTDSQSKRIELEHMSSGIYQIRITINGETRMSTKLVILN